jgi:GTP-binding protein
MAVNTFVTSASVGGPRDGVLRDDVPQFAFAGRSNVGKSTLVNALMREKLARTSAAPGKTRQANIFQMTVSGGLGHAGTWNCYLVDLPGYGYARGGPESVTELAAVVEAYFAAGRRPVGEGPGSETRRRGGIFLLVDSRHPGLKSDIHAHQWIATHAVVPQIIATKVDKLTRAERTRNLRAFADAFGQTPLAVSSDTGEGLDDLRRLMANLAKGVTPE